MEQGRIMITVYLQRVKEESQTIEWTAGERANHLKLQGIFVCMHEKSSVHT